MKEKINKLNQGEDETRTYTLEQLNNIPNISFSNDPKCIKNFDVIIVAVPTPINKDRTPDFSYVEKYVKI